MRMSPVRLAVQPLRPTIFLSRLAALAEATMRGSSHDTIAVIDRSCMTLPEMLPSKPRLRCLPASRKTGRLFSSVLLSVKANGRSIRNSATLASKAFRRVL